MIRARIAQRYARALFELAQKAEKAEPIGEALASVREILAADEELRTALLSPVSTRTVRSQILEAFIDAVQVDPLVANFLRVLLEARKLAYLDDIAQRYQGFADEAAGRVRGEAVTLMPLPASDLDALAEVLSKSMEKDVLLSARQDPAVLGGVVVHVGNLVFDASLRTQLHRMKETLIKG